MLRLIEFVFAAFGMIIFGFIIGFIIGGSRMESLYVKHSSCRNGAKIKELSNVQKSFSF